MDKILLVMFSVNHTKEKEVAVIGQFLFLYCINAAEYEQVYLIEIVLVL